MLLPYLVIQLCSTVLGEGDLLRWTYDGTTVDEQIAQQYQISIVHHNVSDGMVSSSLYISATIENECTKVPGTLARALMQIST